jgi:hypothetical protein
VALVRERTVLIERPPLVGEASCNFCGMEGSRVVSAAQPYGHDPGSPDLSVCPNQLPITVCKGVHGLRLNTQRTAFMQGRCRRRFERGASVWWSRGPVLYLSSVNHRFLYLAWAFPIACSLPSYQSIWDKFWKEDGILVDLINADSS